MIAINLKNGPPHKVSNHVLPPILFYKSSVNSQGMHCPLIAVLSWIALPHHHAFYLNYYKC